MSVLQVYILIITTIPDPSTGSSSFMDHPDLHPILCLQHRMFRKGKFCFQKFQMMANFKLGEGMQTSFAGNPLLTFESVTDEFVLKIINSASAKSCERSHSHHVSL